MDTLTPQQRSYNMSRIRGKDTGAERVVRSLLHKMGYRFRLHNKKLPGKPDIVLPRFRVVIFVNGCFWHRHNACRFATTPATRRAFWLKKFRDNVARDRRNTARLRRSGWRVYTVWGCRTRNHDALARRLDRLLKSTVVK